MSEDAVQKARVAQTTLSRDKLHELIWSIPMMELAERFGVAAKTLILKR